MAHTVWISHFRAPPSAGGLRIVGEGVIGMQSGLCAVVAVCILHSAFRILDLRAIKGDREYEMQCKKSKIHH